MAQNAPKNRLKFIMTESEAPPTVSQKLRELVAARSQGRPNHVDVLHNREIDHLGSTATAEPPLFSALAEPSPAPVVEKQQVRQHHTQELRCGISVCTVCTVHTRLSGTAGNPTLWR